MRDDSPLTTLDSQRYGDTRHERTSAVRGRGPVSAGRFARSVPLRAVLVLAVVALALTLGAGSPRASATDPCADPVTNAVACENSKPGSPASEWDVNDAGDPTIVGFATDMSVNRG